MNLQLFSAMREAERRRRLLQSRYDTVEEMYDRHDKRDRLTLRDLLWCAVAAVGVYALLVLGMSL